jgi:formylglycine-generating enzyme required for sulfatase activity/serine/threonine protein kinase
MSITLDQFTENLTDSGLMSADEVSAFQDSLPNVPSDGETLAKLLVREKKLTKYQATAVYQGKIKHLKFGEYVVVDKIGKGGMGVVLKAHHRRMDRDVAVKVLPEKMMQDEDAEARFYREVQAAAKLLHPNIVVAFEAGEHAGLHYLIMEYVEGRDLAAIVHEHGPLPVEQAVECVRQAAQGLQYAHEEGIVHRDIKPGNLLLDKKGTVKILDMGLARLNVGGLGEGEEKKPEQLTQSGQIMGTVDYMAPEQAEDTRKADHRADIYALGCTLFRLVTGSPVYERDTLMQKLLAHHEDEIPSMVQYRSDVPARLAGIFQRMVAKNPDERYQSMTEVIAALETAFVAAPQAARPAPKKEASSNVALSEFFQHIGDGQVVTKPQTTAATPEETIDRTPSGEDTGDSIAEVESLQPGIAETPQANSPVVSVNRKKTLDKRATKSRQQRLVLFGSIGAATLVLLIVIGFALFGPNRSKKVDLAGGDAAEDNAPSNTDDDIALPSARPGTNFPPDTTPADRDPTPGQNAEQAVLPNGWVIGPAVNLGPIVNSSSDDPAFCFSSDGLTMYFTSNRTGGQGEFDLWRCSRTTTAEPFRDPINLGMNSSNWDYGPFVSMDGKTLLFSSNRPGGLGGHDLWMSTRNLANEPFGSPRNLGAVVNSGHTEFAPYLSANGLTLLFNSDRDGGHGRDDLWMCTREDAEQPWTEPINLGSNVNSEFTDGGPSLSSDGLTLFFHSWRSGVSNIWACTRRTVRDPWRTAFNLGPAVNTDDDEMCPRLSPDGGTFYIVSSRSDGHGERDIWMSRIRRPPEINNALQFDGKSSYVELPLKFAVNEPYTIEATVTYTAKASGTPRVVMSDAVSFSLFADIFTNKWRFGANWHHSRGTVANSSRAQLAGVFNGNVPRLFINGKKFDNSAQVGVANRRPVKAILIGAEPQGRDTPTNHFEGTIDEVRISKITRYDKDFTPPRLGERFEPDEHTLALYHCDEITGGRLIDSSGNGYHGTVHNCKLVRVAPPRAKAPFGEAEAKEHQQAWADYLGVEVERDIELPGGEKLTMVLIPPGEFMMGSTKEERTKFLEEAKAGNNTWAIDRIPSEGPQHRVRITRPFYLGKHEVTQAQWQSVMGTNPSKFKDNPSHPVETTSWDDVQPCLEKLNTLLAENGMQFGLPTEAQWEYACRAGTMTASHCGDAEDDLRQYGWFNAISGRKTHPVGRLRPNAFGLYDLHGNVWEWCADWYAAEYYANSPVDDPNAGPPSSARVSRGGCFHDPVGVCRSAIRGSGTGGRGSDTGFRLAAVIEPPIAKAPFGEAEAKQHQKAWADYLGVEVEREIELPGGEKLTMVLIPPGEFMMGSTEEEQARFLADARNGPWLKERIPSESPQHSVRITRPFYLGKYEVTQAQWQSVSGTNPSNFKDNPSHPVEQVSWDDIHPYLAKLNESTSAEKVTFALPTEAQWEYACRAGTTTPYYGGESENDLREYGWFIANSGQKTHPVGELKRNAFGLYDMHGNVWEWCADWYAADYYAKAPVDNPGGPATGSLRVFRGCSWIDDARYCRSALRYYSALGYRRNSVGFRLAMTIPDSVWRDRERTAGGNYALGFDGVDDCVSADFGGDPIGGDKPFTVEAVVTHDDVEPDFANVLSCVAGVLRSQQGRWAFAAGQDGLASSPDKLSLEPTHLAGVWDGQQAHLFVDGKLVSSARPTAPPSIANQFRVGAFENQGRTNAEFSGKIHQFRISKGARYTTDFAPAQRLEADEQTIVAYAFDEGQGTTLRNSASDRCHGTIHGAQWVKVRAEAGTPNVEVTRADSHLAVIELNQQAEINAYPWLSPDGLTIYWTRESGDAQNSEIWQVSRATADAKWQDARAVAKGRMGAVGDDGRYTVFFPGAFRPDAKMSWARRSSTNEPFGNPQPFLKLETENKAKSPWLSSNGLVLVYQRATSDGKTEFALCSHSARSEPWSAPQVLAMQPDPRFTRSLTWPHLSDDGREIWFTHGGARDGEIVHGRRASGRAPFGDFEFLQVTGQRLIGRSPRYVVATGELFYSRPSGDRGWEIWVLNE